MAQGTQPRPGTTNEGQKPPDASPEPIPDVRRPYEALFGGADTERDFTVGVDFNGAVAEVYDQDIVSEGEPQLGGLYTSFLGDLGFQRRGSRVHLAATGGFNARYYSRLSEFVAADYYGSVGANATVTPTTTLRLDEAVSYAPVALPGLFATTLPPELGEPLPPGGNFAVNTDRYVTSSTNALLDHSFSPRGTVIANASYRRSDYLSSTALVDHWWALDAGGVYGYKLTSTRSVRAGYAYRRASYILPLGELTRQPREHDLFVGVVLDRASPDLRTTFSLEGGTSLVSSSLPTDPDRTATRRRFIFDAQFAQQLWRSWLLLGSVERRNQFDQALGAPVFTDAVSVSLNGFFNRRTDFAASLAYTRGEPSLADTGERFSTGTGGARVRFALSRNWALTAEYFRYFYDYTNTPGLALLTGIPQDFTRNSIRGGLAVWFPVVRH
jgi:hypothetical protein